MFKVGDKVEIINASTSFFQDGDIGIIKMNDGSNCPYGVKCKGDIQWFRAEQLKLVESKPSKNQRITALEETVTKQGEEIEELKLIVEQLRKPSTEVSGALAVVSIENNQIIEFDGKQYKKVEREAREGDVVILRGDKLPRWFTKRMKYKVESNEQIMDSDGEMQCVYNPAADRTPETVDVYELIVEDKHDVPPNEWPTDYPFEKSPNQLRAEIIEKAKGFVEYTATDDTHFEIEGNQVLAWRIIRKGTGYDALTGVAVCSPNDVFNEHIGRAIAVGRMERLDVSEFEQAVQPNEVVVGQIVRNIWGNLENQVYTVTESYENHTTLSVGYVKSQGSDYEIINDTNAIYSEVVE